MIYVGEVHQVRVNGDDREVLVRRIDGDHAEVMLTHRCPQMATEHDALLNALDRVGAGIVIETDTRMMMWSVDLRYPVQTIGAVGLEAVDAVLQMKHDSEPVLWSGPECVVGSQAAEWKDGEVSVMESLTAHACTYDAARL